MTLLPECLDDYVTEENQVRVVDVFVDELDLGALGFEGVEPAATGRLLLKIYIYGYLNRFQSSRRLEREAERNGELMWLTGRLAPDFKTIEWPFGPLTRHKRHYRTSIWLTQVIRAFRPLIPQATLAPLSFRRI